MQGVKFKHFEYVWKKKRVHYKYYVLLNKEILIKKFQKMLRPIPVVVTQQ